MASNNTVSKDFSKTIEKMLSPIKNDERLSQNEKDVRDYIKLVISIARRFVRTRVELEDLVMAGVIGLLEAREKFNPERSKNFKAYAHMRILGKVYSYCQSNSSLISVPTHIAKASSYIERIDRVLESSGIGYDQDEKEGILLNYDHPAEEKLHVSTLGRVKYLKDRVANIAKNSGLQYMDLAVLAFGSLVQTVSEVVLNSHQVSEASVEDKALHKELGEKLQSSLGKKRFLVLQLHSQGYSNPEIAEKLFEFSQTDPDMKPYPAKISRSAVKNLLDNAKAAVKKMRWCDDLKQE